MDASTNKELTICLCTTKALSKDFLYQVTSVLKAKELAACCNLTIASTTPSPEVQAILPELYLSEYNTTIIQSNEILSVARLQLIAAGNIKTPYTLFLDETVTLSQEILSALLQLIRNRKPFDIAGQTKTRDPSLDLISYVTARARRRWSKTPRLSPNIPRFPIKSNFYVARTKFLQEHRYPDYAMAGQYDDYFLADLLAITEGTLVMFPPELSNAIFKSEVPLKNPDDLSDIITPLTGVSDVTLPVSRPILSICLCTYGDYPELALPIIDSILQELDFRKYAQLIVGCNESSMRVLSPLRERFASGSITGLVYSSKNISKSGMQRYMFRMAETPYMMSLDDDVTLKPGWLNAIKDLLIEYHPVELTGFVYEFLDRTRTKHTGIRYQDVVSKKPWWKEMLHNNKVVFPLGGCFTARAAFIRHFDYPEMDIELEFDEVLLGDLLIQAGGKMVNFPESIQSRILLSSVPSRGERKAK